MIIKIFMIKLKKNFFKEIFFEKHKANIFIFINSFFVLC